MTLLIDLLVQDGVLVEPSAGLVLLHVFGCSLQPRCPRVPNTWSFYARLLYLHMDGRHRSIQAHGAMHEAPASTRHSLRFERICTQNPVDALLPCHSRPRGSRKPKTDLRKVTRLALAHTHTAFAAPSCLCIAADAEAQALGARCGRLVLFVLALT